jgi:hypothetical protein
MPALRERTGRQRLTDVFLHLVGDSMAPTFTGSAPAAIRGEAGQAPTPAGPGGEVAP